MNTLLSSLKNSIQKIFVFLLRLDTLSVLLNKHDKDKYCILLSCHDVDRALIQNQVYHSPLFMGLKVALKEKDISYYELSSPLGVLRKHQLTRGCLSFNYLILLIKVYALILSKLNKKTSLDIRVELEGFIYKRILKNLNIDIVFAIDPPHGLCSASRGLGVKVVELMHGNNYSITDEVFREKFNRIEQTLPTDIVAFDDCTADTLKVLTADKRIKTHNSINPWHNYCEEIVSINYHSVRNDFEKRVLVSLQWGYDGEREPLSNILDNGVIHDSLLSLIENNIDWMFFIRLHPIQMIRPWYKRHRQLIQQLSDTYENVEFEYASSSPLSIMLKKVDLHITMSSCCTGEAAELGVPTLLLCPTLEQGGVNYGLFRELKSDNSQLIEYGNLEYDSIEKWVSETDRLSYQLHTFSQKKLDSFYLGICEL
ncbi:hypothetical protein L1D14_25035 [Vibrio tubiashii]|uniref:hypothetical protein n=1 Tax=Vibrio tubiashii TaxID=29498 RepID=UPI001EFC9BAC|nr:hypothetical protein [Vibrio tubiashii]MCG9579476.1 hypothetical protein [Vibrio tubiashii]